ncbi:hypothetical protein DTO96_101098 [Ephemeroptericola cinctiostellae]|uniref:Uncharacterized protein n=1 Tax=Ephemeroptericola cinctiostellae TaxID=2268024 RepID=A0A345DAI0_9BURK|nr:hypothetical protein [Ephemeroptericola cinctiostellae]AXF85368.1 hypothetical protein DTO96_101098 [Ephemeroptericola cinctiostellae]
MGWIDDVTELYVSIRHQKNDETDESNQHTLEIAAVELKHGVETGWDFCCAIQRIHAFEQWTHIERAQSQQQLTEFLTRINDAVLYTYYGQIDCLPLERLLKQLNLPKLSANALFGDAIQERARRRFVHHSCDLLWVAQQLGISHDDNRMTALQEAQLLAQITLKLLLTDKPKEMDWGMFERIELQRLNQIRQTYDIDGHVVFQTDADTSGLLENENGHCVVTSINHRWVWQHNAMSDGQIQVMNVVQMRIDALIDARIMARKNEAVESKSRFDANGVIYFDVQGIRLVWLSDGEVFNLMKEGNVDG